MWAVALLLAVPCAAECLPIQSAAANIGTSKCVTGKVVKVTRASGGTTFLQFCEDYRVCPFQVVVFASDLRHVGDVRQLEGRVIEVQGDIRAYDGRPEIILKQARQLRGEAAKIPPLPKEFDVEKKGRYRAGRLTYPKASRRKAPKRQGPPPQIEDPGEVE